jgi:hypothetical protein
LSTLGDPLADFTYVAMAWVTENGGRSGVMDLDRKALGIPELDEVVERYCAATGRDSVPDMNWYLAYNFFRLAGIMQGIKKRVIDGTASSVARKEKCRSGSSRWLTGPMPLPNWPGCKRSLGLFDHAVGFERIQLCPAQPQPFAQQFAALLAGLGRLIAVVGRGSG